MTCIQCQDIVDRPDLLHIVKTCPGCGRTMYVHKLSKDSKGVQIEEGDRVSFPPSLLKLSLNPLKSNAQFSRVGIQIFAQQIFLESLPNKKDGIHDEIQRISELTDTFLRESPLIQGLDLNDPEHAETIYRHLEENKDTAEWWAMLEGMFYSFLEDALKNNDIDAAIWATACAERCRSMFVFKQEFEEVIWMGQSARRIVDLMRTWDSSKSIGDEGYWQQLFSEHPYALSQVFAVPLVFIQDKAYVGGMNLDRSDARFVDYLFSAESSQEAILIEIKTPTAPLLSRTKYRSIYRPSPELSGAIVQVLDYKSTLVKKLEVDYEASQKFSVFSPRCAIIIGNAQTEFTNKLQRKSFELFRSGLRDIEIVTYDELFRKLDILASLFNLVRKP